jgi:hypothetical protein
VRPTATVLSFAAAGLTTNAACDECRQIVDDDTRISGLVTLTTEGAPAIVAEPITEPVAAYFGGGFFRVGWMTAAAPRRVLAITIDGMPQEAGRHDLATIQSRLCECDASRVGPGNCSLDTAAWCVELGGELELRTISRVCDERCAVDLDLTIAAAADDGRTRFAGMLDVFQEQTLGEHCGRCDAVICDE